MATTAPQVQYREEFIAGFEQNQSLLRKTVTTEANVRGTSAVFLVADSGGATAVTRGLNDLIPARPSNLNQYTVTLKEWHDLVRRTNFDIYTSQGDGRRIMQAETRAVLNRKIDEIIINELNTATQDTGAATTASLSLIMYALAILGNNSVPLDGNVSAVITPSAYAYLLQQKEFTSVDWINNKPFSGQLTSFRWAGINFVVHPNLPGKATANEKLFVYHKNAIGHVFDTESLSIAIGRDEEQDYSFARASGYMGAKLLQNSGVVVINHNGSAHAAQ